MLLVACNPGGPSTAGPFSGDSAAAPPQGQGSDHARALLAATDRNFSPARTLGYGPARDALYAWENERGTLCGLYTGYCVRLRPGDPSIEAGALGINAEHVWPQSMGARAEPLRSDLHHLFPERENANSSRSNLPFGEVPDDQADAWYRGDASQSRTPRTDTDAWSERGVGRWEPRESRKGDVARAVFYVVAVYPDQADQAFFEPMRETLLDWNRRDPPDDDERTRSTWVASLQGTENPFVLDPALADRIWGAGPVSTSASGAAVSAPSGTVQISEIHYDNVGADIGEGVEVAGPPLRLDGWTVVLVNGNDGAAYRTVALAGTLDGGAMWVPVEGIQNGSPDGLELTDPAGRVVEAWSWEGSFTGADGTVFRNLGVAEDADTPTGTSLQRLDDRWQAGRPASPGRPNR